MQWFTQLSSSLWQSPQWLWALAALAIPLVIHLLRRSNPREITFAAVYWLQQQPAQDWKRVRLRDRLLLLLRLLLLTLLAVMLARPLLQQEAPATSATLLVDPRIEQAALDHFLGEHNAFTRVFWLLSEPVPIDTPRPAAPDLWRTLSALADRARFRDADILLAYARNPSGHSALRVSPHWRWHALESGAPPPASPTLAQLGDGPPWLAVAIRSLAEASLPDIELKKLSNANSVDAQQLDWLIYDTPGRLPAALQAFVADGGLLISDRRVHPHGQLPFADIAGNEPLEAAAIGRGSWLRYKRDWHSAAFFRRADLPQQLWQQWAAQDWALQARNRAEWSIDAVPGLPVPDSAVQYARWFSPDRILLWVFALLLALERGIALGRRAVAPAAGEQRA
ncbi:BatA domain-containing protein [Microbulbifer hainanensis]|uniref:BatA domain-containing protein n=1 Tax=Microbulbifer hainanensis TaxID=2735675 RepID=UPI001866665C|nr:BatA domain-containing protein [Microbulbifer hainanensis]